MHRLLAVIALSLVLLLIGCIAGSIDFIDPDDEDFVETDEFFEELSNTGDYLSSQLRSHDADSLLLQLYSRQTSNDGENTIKFFCGWYSSSYSELNTQKVARA
jgi:hypothetical protein